MKPHGFDSQMQTWYIEQPAARSTSTPRLPSHPASVVLAQVVSPGMIAPTWKLFWKEDAGL